MSRNFSTWLRSKAGIASIVGVVVVALLFAVVGQQLGWWGGPAAAGMPPPTPTCVQVPTNYSVAASDPTATLAGIVYTWSGGQQVLNSNADNFSFTISSAAAASLQNVSVGATVDDGSSVTENIGSCNFTLPKACNKLTTGIVAFQFLGAKDNGDNTKTLTFYAKNKSESPLKTFLVALPTGVTPSWPVGTFTGSTCP